jgi:hypothetical protein
MSTTAILDHDGPSNTDIRQIRMPPVDRKPVSDDRIGVIGSLEPGWQPFGGFLR